ncbi:hypothetical protein ACI65C_004502 [Semiaphis heraclei]
MTKTIANLISKKGKLRLSNPPSSPVAKAPDQHSLPERPPMKDASHDTVLTPSWWDSDATFEAERRRIRTVRKTRSLGKTNGSAQTKDTEVESAIDTDAEAPWSSFVKRGAKKRTAATTLPRPPAAVAPPKPPAKPNRPPAIHVRPAEGKSYTDTVRSHNALDQEDQRPVRLRGWSVRQCDVEALDQLFRSRPLEVPVGGSESNLAQPAARALDNYLEG